jgi:hypothetical protein
VDAVSKVSARLQQGCKTVVRLWYFLTRTRWSNGPRSRLADPESSGVPDVGSQQGAARAAICRVQINLLPLNSYRLRPSLLARQVRVGCHTGDTNPTSCVAVRMAREEVACTVVKHIGW